MPYSSFTATKKGIVAEKTHGGSVTFHTKSKSEAHRRAAIREMAARGQLRIQRGRR